MTDEQRAPSGAAEVDEFAGIRPRRSFSPVVAGAGVALALYLGVSLRHDLRYALVDDRPEALGAAGRAAAAGALVADRYVRLEAPLDRAGAQALLVKTTDGYKRVLRVRGAGGALVALLPRDDRGGPTLLVGDRIEGRLEALDDAPFGGSVRAAFARQATVRLIEASALRAGAAPGAPIRDAAGEAAPIDDAAPARLLRRVPGRLDVRMAGDRWPGLAAARAALEAVVGAPAVRTAAEEGGLYRFEVEGDAAALAALRARFRDRSQGVQAVPLLEDRPATWGQLRAGPAGLSPGGPGGAAVPWAELDGVVVEGPLPLAARAFVLVEGERPADLWYAAPLYGVFAVGLALNALALTTAWRRRRRLARVAAAQAPS